MAWVWWRPRETSVSDARFDKDASGRVTGHEVYSEWPVDFTRRPVFRSEDPVRRYKALHCPPFDSGPVVDDTWRKIVLEFVPGDRIQFLPVRLIAGEETCDDFMFAIPFDRVICIDVERSKIVRKIERLDKTTIFSVDRFVHYEDCLNGLHMAHDLQMSTHLVVSDALKEALSETGQDNVFYRPEELRR